MTHDDHTRSRADAEFQAYVDLARKGDAPDVEEFVRSHPPEMQRALRRMIADYHNLRQSLGDTTPSIQPGRVLGDFELVRELGRGGMSVVWEARQVSLQRSVALKLLLAQHTLSPDSLERFQREARAGGRLSHPGIVKTYAVGESEGIHWIAQELVPGGYTLADSIADLREERELPEGYYRGVAELFAKVADALQHAHDQGVIHRDVKPSNILLSEGDLPRVADFGLAKIQDELGLSRTGDIEGTPYYMSPEQASAKVMGVDHRTDVFSLGSTLYEALTLTRAFEGDTSQHVFRRILTVDPPDPRTLHSRVPRDVAVICLKSLEKDPERRYAGTLDLAEDLRRFLRGEAIVARPPGTLERMRKWSRRNTAASVGILVSAIALIVISGLLLQTLKAEHRAALERDRATESAARADLAAQQARQAEKSALSERDHARRQSYMSGLFTAQALMGAGEFGEAGRKLESCPEEYRDWEWAYLSLQIDPSLQVLSGHEQAIHSFAFSPDGTRLVSISADNTLRTWDTATGEQLSLRKTIAPTAIAYSPIGSHLVTGSGFGPLSVWDLESGEKPSHWKGHSQWVTSLAYRGDGRRLVSGSWDETVRVWDTERGESILTLRGHEGWVSSVAYDPSGLRIASGSQDGTARIWDAETGKELHVLEVGLSVEAVSFDQTGKILIVGASAMHYLSMWNVEAGVLVKTLEGHSQRVECVALSPTGARFVSGSADRTLRVWDAEHGEHLATLEGHGDSVETVAYSPDGIFLATAVGVESENPSIRLWDAHTYGARQEIVAHDSPVTAVAYGPDGRRFASASWDDSIRVWDAQTGEPLSTWHVRDVRCLAFHPDGEYMIVGTKADGLKLLSASSGESIRSFGSHQRPVEAVAFSPDGARLASAAGLRPDQPDSVTDLLTADSVTDLLTIWDAHTGEKLQELHGHHISVDAVTFSPDGTRLVSGSVDGSLRMWDVATGEQVSAIHMNPVDIGRMIDDPSHSHFPRRGDVNAVAFSPNGAQIVCGGNDRTVRVFSVETAECVRILRGHEDEVTSVVFLPTGNRIVSGSMDGTIRLWSSRDGELTVTLRGSAGGVTSVAVSPDGRRILSGMERNPLYLWESDLEQARTMWQFRDRLRQATPWIERLFLQHLLSERVVQAIESTVDPLVDRELAIRLARAHGDSDPRMLDRAAWDIVKRQNHERSAFLLAQRLSSAANRLSPEEPRYMSTLGAAFYRLGEFERAIEILRNAEPPEERTATPEQELVPRVFDEERQLRALGYLGPDGDADSRDRTVIATFLAMCYWRLEQPNEARRYLRQSRRSKEQVVSDDVVWLLEEAEELIDGNGD